MIPQKPDFFRRNFKMQRKLFCEKCKDTTLHQIEVIKDSPEDDGVPCLKTCIICWQAHDKLKDIGIEEKHPVLFQRFYTQSYVYLVLHPFYLE